LGDRFGRCRHCNFAHYIYALSKFGSLDCSQSRRRAINRYRGPPMTLAVIAPLGMRIPYLIGPLPVIGDNARSVARRATPFILSALINNTFSVAFRADVFSHLCAVPSPGVARSTGRAGSPALRILSLDRLPFDALRKSRFGPDPLFAAMPRDACN
jgi:hypothetical protein